jgi:alanine dehydrogenase
VKIGIPREVKTLKNRIACTPGSVRMFTHHGHHVYLEKGAGLGSGFSDEAYVDAGAELITAPDELWQRSEMGVKVKELLPDEFHRLRPDLVLFTYLHLAAAPELARVLMEKPVTAIAYENGTGGTEIAPLGADERDCRANGDHRGCPPPSPGRRGEGCSAGCPPRVCFRERS